MRKKLRFNVLLTRMLSFAMALLGFSACDSFRNEPLDMYGSPVATYKIKGRVVDSENKEVGLPDIQVLVRPGLSNYYYADTLHTNDKGEFCLEKKTLYDDQIKIVYEDKTGAYKKDSVEVEPVQTEKGSGAWNRGTFESDVTIEMERKTVTEEEK